MMELVDMLGLGSSSLLSKGSSPFFGKYFKHIMPTYNQLCTNIRKKKKTLNKTPALQGCPQKKGSCLENAKTLNPRKPNSGDRMIIQLLLSNFKIIYAFIPGEGDNKLEQHSKVMIRGGGVNDLPGIKYRLVRGKFDFVGLTNRKTSRSKYGTKKLKEYL